MQPFHRTRALPGQGAVERWLLMLCAALVGLQGGLVSVHFAQCEHVIAWGDGHAHLAGLDTSRAHGHGHGHWSGGCESVPALAGDAGGRTAGSDRPEVQGGNPGDEDHEHEDPGHGAVGHGCELASPSDEAAAGLGAQVLAAPKLGASASAAHRTCSTVVVSHACRPPPDLAQRLTRGPPRAV